MSKQALLTLRAVIPCLVLLSSAQAADQQWILAQSTLSYHVSHPLHQVDGISRGARGKGICHDGQCDFLIAAPVKSFDSGDSNRDLHMLQVTRAADNPMVQVRTQLPETAQNSATVRADLQIQFAGQTVEYKQVEFQLTKQVDDIHLSGTIPAKLGDFKIDPPTLLTMPVKNDIPVKVDMLWHRE